MNKKEFGKRIQKVRKSRGLTARMLAEMISIDDTFFAANRRWPCVAEPSGLYQHLQCAGSISRLFSQGLNNSKRAYQMRRAS